MVGQFHFGGIGPFYDRYALLLGPWLGQFWSLYHGYSLRRPSWLGRFDLRASLSGYLDDPRWAVDISAGQALSLNFNLAIKPLPPPTVPVIRPPETVVRTTGSQLKGFLQGEFVNNAPVVRGQMTI